jgi:hypothetical protein
MSAIYPKCRAKFAQGQIDLVADTIGIVPTSSGYDANHEFLSSLTILGSGVALSSKSIDLATGRFFAADVTGGNVTGAIGAFVIYKSTGNPATEPLIAYINDGPGFPSTLSNEPWVIRWQGQGIFTI